MEDPVNKPKKFINYDNLKVYLYDFSGSFEVHIVATELEPDVEKVEGMLQYLDDEGFLHSSDPDKPVQLFIVKK